MDFDPETGLVVLRSMARLRPEDTGGGGESRPEGSEAMGPTHFEEALKRGLVKLIVWDHSALSLEVVYAAAGHKTITVGIGTGGIHRFDALAQLAELAPAQVTPALMSILLEGPSEPASPYPGRHAPSAL
jgi:hypothetical protein